VTRAVNCNEDVPCRKEVRSIAIDSGSEVFAPSSSNLTVGKIPWPFVLWDLCKGTCTFTESKEKKSNDRVFVDGRLDVDEATYDMTTMVIFVEAATSWKALGRLESTDIVCWFAGM
jgi:hypothetical protein